VARRDLNGAVDFGYLETYAGGDYALVEEVLGIFRQQQQVWAPMLEASNVGWRDAVHTLKGSARGIGANALAVACEAAEQQGADGLPGVLNALDEAMADVAAYLHELALQSLRAPRR